MTSARRGKTGEAPSTPEAILDAVEAIMKEEGYAAVSSRRVAEKAGLKSRLAGYHFGTMDELFLAVLHRMEDRHFAQCAKIIDADNQLEYMWNMILDSTDMVLMLEFTALAVHRKAIRKQIARVIERARAFEAVVLARALEHLKIGEDKMPPMVLAVLLSGAVRVFMTERAVGVSKGHEETLKFINKEIAKIGVRNPA
jgi:AcrR family transcriptional regulator